MNRAGIKQHAIDKRLIRRERGPVLVAADRLKNNWRADFSGFNPLHGGAVCGVVAPHESDLHADTRFCHCVDCLLRIGNAESRRLLAKHVFAGRSHGLHCRCMELVWSCNYNSV